MQDIQEDAKKKILTEMIQDGLGDIISLSEETFIALPSAFSPEGTHFHTSTLSYFFKDIDINQLEKWRKLNTSPNFIDKVTEFAFKITKQIERRQHELDSNMVRIHLSANICFVRPSF